MDIVELKFGNIKFEDDFVIVTINSGVNVENGVVNQLIEVINQHFAGRSYCYINNHLNDYSIEPLETQRIIAETPVRAMAVLIVSAFSLKNLNIEKLFYDIPLLIATDLEEAKQKLKPFLTEDKVENLELVRAESVQS